jgi:hypothetical protein
LASAVAATAVVAPPAVVGIVEEVVVAGRLLRLQLRLPTNSS